MARNPFTPSFGSNPPLLVGRGEAIDAFGHSLDDGPGSPRRATLLTGPRGMGKTVMLNALEDQARTRGWLVISETATAGLAARITTDHLPRLLAAHDPDPNQRHITGIELPFRAGGLSTTTEQRYQPQPSLRSQIERLTDVLEQHETGVLITVDEVHGAPIEDLREITTTVQHAFREDRAVALVAAGLLSAVRDLLNDEVLTFLRRAEREHLGTIDLEDVTTALREPIERAGRTIESQALDIAARGTQGYPFLIQLVGYHTFNINGDSATITSTDAENGVQAARRRAGRLVHEPALADLSPIDRTYLAAMSLDDGPSSTSDVAARMGTTPNYANAYRRRLIDAELITSVRHGQVDFALPGLRDYLREHAAAEALNAHAEHDTDSSTGGPTSSG